VAATIAGIAPIADARTRTLSGSCSFSGPIFPSPPITVIPEPGPHFSYNGTGACTGRFDGAMIAPIPVTVTFMNASTLFDTCELGPDLNLSGILGVRVGKIKARFPITINLVRLALAGPFVLTTPLGGRAAGTAMFTPSDPAAALRQCITTGVATATLSGRFQTLSPLVGS
jgi:hypothetical protein